MGTPAHRPLTAAFPLVGGDSVRKKRPEGSRSRPTGKRRDQRDPSTPGASRPPLRTTKPLAAAFPLVATHARVRSEDAGTPRPPARPGRTGAPPSPETPSSPQAPRPVGSFDSGRFAPCAQDDNPAGASRPALRMTKPLAAAFPLVATHARVRSEDAGAYPPAGSSRPDGGASRPGSSVFAASAATSGILRLRALRALRSG